MEIKKKPKLHHDWIHPDALEVVQTLQESGFVCYLVGGCVRDLLAGIPPKDFDIATSALPNQVRRYISRAYVIGKRFRLVLVKRGHETFEVATFRRAPTPEELAAPPESGPTGDNFFGTPEEDAIRRDFTLNGLFYDPIKDQLLDYCGGVKDVEDGIIRMIGNPSTRLIEDPIRILRALRLAHKLRFSIEPSLREAMQTHASELTRSVLPRRREEFLKILRLHDPSMTFHEAHDLGILKYCSPTLDKVYGQPETCEEMNSFIHRIPHMSLNTDNPVELFGTLVLAYFRVNVENNPFRQLTEKDLEENEELNQLCKNELGMFNLEQKIVFEALRLQEELRDVAEFEKRGRRRQNGFLRNDALPLALHFAAADHVLAPQTIQYWKTRLEKSKQAFQKGDDDPSNHP